MEENRIAEIENLEKYIKKNLEKGDGEIKIGRQFMSGDECLLYKLNEDIKFKNKKKIETKLKKGDYLVADKSIVVGLKERNLNNEFEILDEKISPLYKQFAERFKTDISGPQLAFKNKETLKVIIADKYKDKADEILKMNGVDYIATASKKNTGPLRRLFVLDKKDEEYAEIIQSVIKRQILKEKIQEIEDKMHNVDNMTKQELEDFKKEINGIYESSKEIGEKSAADKIQDISEKIEYKIKEKDIEEKTEDFDNNYKEYHPQRKTEIDRINEINDERDDDNPYEERSLF